MGAAASGSEAPHRAATRRTDPERRDRIIDATLEVIARDGVAGTSHRRVAAHANVPLGSMTYHFDGMNELLKEAFTRFAEAASERFERRLASATTLPDARAAIESLVHEDIVGSQEELVVTLELYTLAAREPAFRAITQAWMRRSRSVLRRHFDADTARALDALIEGLGIHLSLDPEPHERALSAEAIARMTPRYRDADGSGGRDAGGSGAR